MNCLTCNFVWTRLDICPTLPIHDCSKFQSKVTVKTEPISGTELTADAIAGATELGDLTLLDKGKHYAIALAKWFRAGCPQRTQAEAEACEAICKSNPADCYDAENDSCKICGCPTSAKRWAIKSKTKMATENCPKGLWDIVLQHVEHFLK